MLPEEIQKHLDAIKVDEDKLAKLRAEPTVQSTIDRLLVAAEPVFMEGLDLAEVAVEGAVPGGPLAHAALKVAAKLLEDGLGRWIEKKKIAP